ncbi:plasminogen-like [Branchiostoma lanceolatum]|uniref:plasminogen-like n=1 Tax=Branchiostoma lanceolatum TaxID=7740 RepID=UPI003451C84E
MRLFLCTLLAFVATTSGAWSFWNPFGSKDQLLRQDDDDLIPDKDCYRGNGEKYQGRIFLTEKDEMCLRWDSSEVLFRSYNVLTHPDGEYGVGEHNYCRNPAPGTVSRPWCYVASEDDWDYCNILKCMEDDDICAEPVCNNICEYGFKKDDSGCDTCDCKDPPVGKRTTAKPIPKPTPEPTTKPEEKKTPKPKEETTKKAPMSAMCPAIDLSDMKPSPISSCPSGSMHTVGKVCWVMCTNGAPIEIAVCQEDGTWSKDLSDIKCKESAPKVPAEPTTPKVEVTTAAPVKTTVKKTTPKHTTVKPTVAKTTRKPEAAEKPDPATMGPKKTAPPSPAPLTKTCPKLNIPENSLTNCYGAEQKVQTSCGVLCLKSDKTGPITMTTTCLEDGKWSKPKEGKLACEEDPIIPPNAMSDGNLKMPTESTSASPDGDKTTAKSEAAKPTKAADAANTEKPTAKPTVKPTVKPTTKAPEGTDVLCYTSRGENYRGKKATTREGQLCMKWSDPQLKYYYYNTNNFGKEEGLGDHRYCRNPAPESEPWCYYRAVNGKVEFKVCGVPKC